MLVCDKCSTHNPDTARFCEACGTPLWLTGRTAGSNSLSGAQGNGSNGKVHPVSVSPSGAHLIEESTAPLDDSHRVHATLVIERGVSAGKKFPISSQEANIGRW